MDHVTKKIKIMFHNFIIGFVTTLHYVTCYFKKAHQMFGFILLITISLINCYIKCHVEAVVIISLTNKNSKIACASNFEWN